MFSKSFCRWWTILMIKRDNPSIHHPSSSSSSSSSSQQQQSQALWSDRLGGPHKANACSMERLGDNLPSQTLPFGLPSLHLLPGHAHPRPIIHEKPSQTGALNQTRTFWFFLYPFWCMALPPAPTGALAWWRESLRGFVEIKIKVPLRFLLTFVFVFVSPKNWNLNFF